MGTSLPINFSAMAYALNRYDFRRVIDLINDAIVSASDPPSSFIVRHFLAARWASVVRKRKHSLFDSFKKRRGDRFKFFLGARQDDDSIAHLRLRRMSARASSKGMGTSPEAFRSSIARMSSTSSNSSRSFSYSSMLMTTAIRSPFSLVRNCVGSFIATPCTKSSVPPGARQEPGAVSVIPVEAGFWRGRRTGLHVGGRFVGSEPARPERVGELVEIFFALRVLAENANQHLQRVAAAAQRV